VAKAPEGQITAPPKAKPGLQNAADISTLRQRIATDRSAGPAPKIDTLKVGQKDAPAAEKKAPELTDREVTSRLLERKRKARDE